ncbi:hypothetical protein J3F83DRAFT_735342 [Trichoderma novae-zelandiae]
MIHASSQPAWHFCMLCFILLRSFARCFYGFFSVLPSWSIISICRCHGNVHAFPNAHLDRASAQQNSRCSIRQGDILRTLTASSFTQKQGGFAPHKSAQL